ncbi:MAG: Exported zinc metalloprotease YfgC precursor [Burkholderiaceae bacterium]|jgi:predicted Zn-dependent protease|nr:MAG: Exported zinc metalloprotease YfgC precursor [Burkholderiaceae bacterium]
MSDRSPVPRAHLQATHAHAAHVQGRTRVWLRALGAGVLSLALMAAPLPAAAQAQPLPSLGDGGDLSIGAERRMGEQVARALYRDPSYIDDPVLAEYVQGVWTRLLAAARALGEIGPEMEQRYAWQIVLGADPEINAFAVPGGYLGLELGLIAAVDDPDELAAVLAHELSHVTQRHISRMMAQDSRTLPLIIGAILVGALAASRNPDVGNAVIAGSQAAAISGQLKFSRDMEREADRVGYGVLVKAGYSPKAFAAMFEKLRESSRLNDDDAYPYLRTHPLTGERIADMQARAQFAGGPPLPPLSVPQAMIKARAQVLSHGGVDALRAAVAEGRDAALDQQSRVHQVGALYGAALASMKLRQFDQARDFVARLEPLAAGDAAAARLARLLAAEIAWNAGDAAQVARLIAPTAPGRPELVLSSEARIRLGQSKAVAERLRDWVATHPQDPTAWQLLGQAYQAEGEPVRAIRAEAERQVALVDFGAAVDRYKAAQDLIRQRTAAGQPVDFVEASIIDARLREVQQQQKDLDAKR